MDKKTEELRDMFLNMTDEATVTERQEEAHGSLSTEEKIQEQLLAVVTEMRERYEFNTTLDDEQLATVVRRFYAGDDDEEIAAELGEREESVARARIDLHLFTLSDTETPFEIERLRMLVDDDVSTADCAGELDVSEATVRHYQRVLEAKDEARAVNQQYTNEFENILQDREISDRMTGDIQQDGLDDATDGMETNVSF
ncbi:MULTISPECIES: conditioned medium-induced protein 4 [unclassified Haladaptatus]|uniref:conditioned medium-induced protein 4 n=1 Tax=unclassified Haladaptatus TaxID=2622732 RepID=UPI00209C64EF|nr:MULTISPECIES: conditioned medium-induced protein 4 [unclassified Haladaptatus]MCO8242675.1 conditioned medium-induced protein 4 [Haladaptatus sp. AB643]MCO8252434.1 conditioned medium-induced protein 4 [Haladaptatus sp. AB618]